MSFLQVRLQLLTNLWMTLQIFFITHEQAGEIFFLASRMNEDAYSDNVHFPCSRRAFKYSCLWWFSFLFTHSVQSVLCKTVDLLFNHLAWFVHIQLLHSKFDKIWTRKKHTPWNNALSRHVARFNISFDFYHGYMAIERKEKISKKIFLMLYRPKFRMHFATLRITKHVTLVCLHENKDFKVHPLQTCSFVS